jgi:nucleoside-diphosphate-sugar epimerase
MRVLVTGSAGHLGEALMRLLPSAGHQVVGLDLAPSPFTTYVGSICDRAFVHRCLSEVDAVLHTATLHKPHVVTHPRQAFIDTNISGTLNLLEESVGRRRPRVRFHEHYKCLRARAGAPGRRAGRVDHRGRDTNPEEHLWHH